MSVSDDLTARIRKAGEYMTKHGRTVGRMVAPDGSVCLTGAIRYCQPQTGDEHIIREVLLSWARAESWNDDPNTTTEEVLRYLDTTTISDDDLRRTFGPQWEEIVSLVRRFSSTEGVVAQFSPEMRLPTVETTKEASDFFFELTDYYVLSSVNVVYQATLYATPTRARYFQDVAVALATRHLIGDGGLTQEVYNALTRPLADIVDKIHPEDILED